jgi:thiosulfate reductase cytochrome b subunit
VVLIQQKLRQGLPRYPGGAAWPPSTEADANATHVAVPGPSTPSGLVEPVTSAPASIARDALGQLAQRQGLPRIAGGSPWPPQTVIPAAKAASDAPATPSATDMPPSPVTDGTIVSSDLTRDAKIQTPTVATPATQAIHSATPSQTPSAVNQKAPEINRLGPLNLRQWIIAVILGAFCAIGMATALVLATRWLLSFEPVQEFMERFPGEYHLPENAPVGIPAWMGWQHFFNVFLMVLIIRTGLQVRRQQKPPAYWSSKRSPKVSINLWLHLSLDLLWLINGAAFVVLLFATGHWMRLVPTSWEVFPNAISAGLQYMSLDWPTENGWVNYNALQQLAYFVTVFIAAPLAATTGYRMSALWPKQATKLNRLYPAEWARKVHFPVMLYFVVFIFIHVALVFSTGALRNLNHMYAAQGSLDPTEFAANWTGFWMFTVSLLVIAGAWILCRPILLAPIARIFGTVSSR